MNESFENTTSKKGFGSFWKTYSYPAVKLFVTQIVFSIFGLTLSIATGKSGNRFLQLFVSIFAVVFFLVMVYTDIFKVGSEDGVRIKGGRLEYDSLTGLKIGLLAASPDLLLAAVGTLSLFPDGSIPSRIGAVAQMLHLWIQGAYTGILATDVGGTPMNALFWAHFLIIIPMVLVAFGSYILGAKDKRLTRLLIPENPEEKEIKREEKKKKG